MTPGLPTHHEEGRRHLSNVDPVLAAIIERVGPCTVVAATRQDLFQALLRSIIYQQLHGRAAAAIHARVLKAAGGRKISAKSLSAIPDEPLRAAGLSANKLKAIRDLAAKTLDGTMPTPRAAAKMSDDELVERLTSIRGIGPWTVHMLMIFHLGRPDVMPTGDYAVRKAFSVHFRRGRAIKPETLLRHARKWQPYRSLASWYLWRSLDTVVPDGG